LTPCSALCVFTLQPCKQCLPSNENGDGLENQQGPQPGLPQSPNQVEKLTAFNKLKNYLN